jgi:outer membrane immunogenic protein
MLASAAMFVLAFAGATAGATDLPSPPILTKAPPLVTYGWTGCYLGAHVGGGWGRTDVARPPTLGAQSQTVTQTQTTTETQTTTLPQVPPAKIRDMYQGWDWKRHWDWDRDKDRAWDWDRRRDKDRDRDRDKYRDSSWEREWDWDRDRRRDKDKDHDRDADKDHHQQPNNPPRTVTTTTTTSVVTTTTQTIAAGLLGSAFTDESAGVLGGGQVGCDYQLNSNWVIGLEGDVSAAGISGSAADPSLTGRSFGNLHTDTSWLASVTGRVGYTFERFLLFVRGGAAWMHQTYDYAGVAGVPFDLTGSDTRIGWTAGAGVEWAILAHWSAKVEYDYYGFGTGTVSLALPVAAGPVSITQSIQTVTAGLNYHF